VATKVTDRADPQEIEVASVDGRALDGAGDHVIWIELHRVSGRRFVS
jgi:hypothetical protein